MVAQRPGISEFSEGASFLVEEPRIVYINMRSKQKDTGMVYQRVERTLPRAKEPIYLYESSMEETFFR